MKKRNLTIAEIRSKYRGEKMVLDRDDPWLNFVARPISIYPTWLFLRFGISANKTTLLVVITGIIGCAFLALGNYWAIVVGAILMNISFLFDVIDGNVARCTNSCTLYGAYIDRISDAFLLVLTPISIGIGLYNHPDPYLNHLLNLLFGTGINNNFFIFLGMIYSLFYVFRFFITAAVSATFPLTPRNFYKLKTRAEGGAWRIIYTFGYCLQGTAKWMIVLVAAIANILSIFVALWTLITACDLIIVFIRTLRLMKVQIVDETHQGQF